jgi:hypothetical protein
MGTKNVLIAWAVVGIGCGGSLGDSSASLEVVAIGHTSTGGSSTSGESGGTSTGGASGADAGLPCCNGYPHDTNGSSTGGQNPSGDCTCDGACQTVCGSGTPLVLSLLHAPVEFTEASGYFDLSGASEPRQTDWVAPSTPWLCLDRDGNGRIDDGSELFGSMTRLSNGRRATNGFEALRELDGDGDGFLTPADAAWGDLLVWSDRNQDRVSQADELISLSATPILAIELAYHSAPRCDARGNCEVERARVYYVGANQTAAGALVDVHLPSRLPGALARRAR